MKVKWRDTLPGEKFFGGKGCLVPFTPEDRNPSQRQRALDPNDPLHTAIESVVAGLSPEEKVARLHKLFPPKRKDQPQSTEEGD